MGGLLVGKASPESQSAIQHVDEIVRRAAGHGDKVNKAGGGGGS